MNIIYYIVFFFWYLLSLLPLRLLYVLSDLLFYPCFYLIRYRRKVVHQNLKEVFYGETEEELLHTEKQFYHFFCDYIVETIKLFSISKKEMMRRMTFGGVEEMRQAMQRENKKMCFIYLGHYCNWEYVASLSYWLEDMHCGQIYHPIYNKSFNQLFLRLRGQFGGESIAMKETLRRLIQLRKGDKPVAVGFIADQSPKWESMHHWTWFLNHDTSFFIGTERIGKQLDAAIYYLELKRVKRGYYHGELKCLSLHPNEIPDYELTDRYAACLEEQIREEPAYWLWSHKRWKRTKEEWLRRQQEENNPVH